VMLPGDGPMTHAADSRMDAFQNNAQRQLSTNKATLVFGSNSSKKECSFI